MANRQPNSVALKWSPGLNTGGSVIRDYRISMAIGDGTFFVVAETVVGTSYIVTGLNAGDSYRFQVESRNDAYHSNPTSEISVLCAAIPAVPAAPTVSNFNEFIAIDWEAPNNNGLPILSYTVLTKKLDGSFVQDLSFCVSDDADLLANTYCQLPQQNLLLSPYLF